MQSLPERMSFWRQGDQWAVRDGGWKLFVREDAVRLFDLDSDIAEKHDLSDAHPDRVMHMRQAFEAWCEEGDA